MPALRVTRRPLPEEAIQWDGSNVQEIETVFPGEITDNGDGTLKVYLQGGESIVTANVGDWLTWRGGFAITVLPDDFMKANYQELPPDGPYTYGVTVGDPA